MPFAIGARQGASSGRLPRLFRLTMRREAIAIGRFSASR
jgi:hypothetical protein